MKVPPVFLRGAHKSAMRAKDCEWHEDTKSVVVCRRWKLFVLLPRILLFRLVRGGRVPKNQLLDRFQKFANGEWVHRLGLSGEASGSAASNRRHCREEG